ncbi:aminotransferase class V-fold PLP-dependent enzyme [Baekduia sp. Peel2402]|uniref:aminotransferase class V-fold PLP-dependent enzyme n=1 Tax=Baekduia sp. Peel2402 TaxID=3458296 RepID=UPI00403E6EF2
MLGADLRVPLADGRSARYVNLDYAATAPALACVAERVNAVLPYAGSVHRGSGVPSRVASGLYENARESVGQRLGARADDHVIFTRNTTDATNLLAACVPAGRGDVVTLDVEHHANLLPWRRAACGTRVVAHAPTLAETLVRVEDALGAAPAALLAITGASNVTGEVLPLEEIVAIARRHGTRVFVDAAQLAPHRAIDLAESGVDYLALSGHKAYAPYGAGVLVGRADWLDAAPPYLAGGGAVVEVTVDDVAWADGPRRHEAGTPNLAGAVALAAALDALAELPLADHEAALRRTLLEGLGAIAGVTTLSIWSDTPDAIGTVAFTVEGYAPGLVGAYLSAEHGIGLRDGRFCAHPLLARFGLPDGAVRASFGLGSRHADAERLIAAIEKLVTDGPANTYNQTSEGWLPADDRRDLTTWLGADVSRAKASPCERRRHAV